MPRCARFSHRRSHMYMWPSTGKPGTTRHPSKKLFLHLQSCRRPNIELSKFYRHSLSRSHYNRPNRSLPSAWNNTFLRNRSIFSWYLRTPRCARFSCRQSHMVLCFCNCHQKCIYASRKFLIFSKLTFDAWCSFCSWYYSHPCAQVLSHLWWKNRRFFIYIIVMIYICNNNFFCQVFIFVLIFYVQVCIYKYYQHFFGSSNIWNCYGR